ncbi:type II toxin-antitoxin system RelE/ParE family toxin [Zunongwangia sp. F260]|uniref:Type II toxin-antitoxin system RelE/ParE family toxin n=1 Tax=Autumnicola lenta TaxID=3075593 RepID=A0ABU3CJZ4_9FLAO|nr:type II toxin-antitoxin system RelE/ParE family toxin [Zunongwangia sp. F260]MDT0646670.1 type II toxin-antitoxin system RelE/ParE family toxin [Zunongwangia sp. F260]
MIAVYPEIGKLTDHEDVRIKIVRDYFIIYKEESNRIVILSIWNSRQNPGKLKSIF